MIKIFNINNLTLILDLFVNQLKENSKEIWVNLINNSLFLLKAYENEEINEYDILVIF